ncbi:MAG TPA: cobyric acid synthase [Fibrobacteria bacterium]|nr:cobyric acid synthase [Fibrobacteria bacterium]
MSVLSAPDSGGPEAPRRARALMVLGTTSHAGKSTIAAALCRCLARKGYAVAPFKAQNMSLNSWVTPEGAEIGRAQAVQARAAGIEPHADMNPLLLKPAGGHGMQVVALGKPIGNFTGREYYARKRDMRALVHAAYDRLAARFEAVVLEGAGSPAEINLREEDLVNGSMAEYAGARCILVADIERGGVFASILGTVSLLEAKHRGLLAGVLINKFRGDVSLLDSGIREIESLTGVPVLGVLPFVEGLDLEEEDSLGLDAGTGKGEDGTARTDGKENAWIDIAVVRLPCMSNATDFQPLQGLERVRLRYASRPEEMGNPDLILLPGSKNVRQAAEFLRQGALDRVLRAAADRDIPLLGICGGFQILGRRIFDPHGIEGPPGETAGLGLLPVETVLEREKEVCRVEAENLAFPFLEPGEICRGYEIHMGRTRAEGEGRPLLGMLSKNGFPAPGPSGFAAAASSIFGCYMHGLFEGPRIREGLFRWLCGRKGLDWPGGPETREGAAGDSLDRMADLLEARFDPVTLLP